MINYKKTAKLLLLLGVLALANVSLVIRADTITFGGADLSWYQTGAGATPYHIWVAGDYWEQSFTTSLSQANSFDLNLAYDDNGLSSAQTLQMEVLVNGSFVGDFSISPSQSLSDLNFQTESEFAGPTFDIRLEALNTIPGGDGAVSLDSSGLSTGSITNVPEPSTFTLLAVGAISLVPFAWRRGRRVA